ncbi:hypothetical protein RIF29_33452 [Crotalaria pallida]|uniref:Uncharacterized protein n=1 Tax=Crotalaria pallida TaxID=3830 RepID=A0AAN9E8B1_CROPI
MWRKLCVLLEAESLSLFIFSVKNKNKDFGLMTLLTFPLEISADTTHALAALANAMGCYSHFQTAPIDEDGGMI